MANIYDIVTSKEIASYWTESSRERVPYFGASKFPVKKKLGLDLSWIKGAKGSPVSLSLSAFDSKAIPLNRVGFKKLSADMPFFKNSKNIDEKQRQELNKVIGSGNATIIDIIINQIFDDKSSLISNALVAQEMMRMQILTTGSLAVANNGQSYSYDYGVPADNKKTLTNTAKWDAPTTADPIRDILSWQEIVTESTGETPTELLMNSTTLRLIGKCDSIKNAIYVMGNGKVVPSTSAVKKFILEETDCIVYTYDKGYKNDSAVFTKFVADKIVVVMPSSNLGDTFVGTTPEESDLINDSSASVDIVEMGIAITTSKEIDPVNVMTKASMISLPSFELADSVVIATVA